MLFKHKINPEKFHPNPFWDIVGFLFLLLFMILLMFLIYFIETKFKINTHRLAIPYPDIKTTELKDRVPILNKFYKKIIKVIEQNLNRNNLVYQKKSERETKGLLPFVTLLILEVREINIRIIREKYNVGIHIGNVKSDQEYFIENELKKIIENVVIKKEKIN
jgi:hypothetical protein